MHSGSYLQNLNSISFSCGPFLSSLSFPDSFNSSNNKRLTVALNLWIVRKTNHGHTKAPIGSVYLTFCMLRFLLFLWKLLNIGERTVWDALQYVQKYSLGSQGSSAFNFSSVEGQRDNQECDMVHCLSYKLCLQSRGKDTFTVSFHVLITSKMFINNYLFAQIRLFLEIFLRCSESF